ncbi:MAG: 30S ribosomal protein S17, partial [Candidatus Thermoplasmatota archaeon]
MANAKEPSAPKAPRVRDIGIDVPAPAKACEDPNCPFHGSLRVRGQAVEGTIVSTRMQRTVGVEREYLQYITMFERYERRTRRMLAHAPRCRGLVPG